MSKEVHSDGSGVQLPLVTDNQDVLLLPIQYREENNLSVAEFAKLVDVSPRQIYQYESKGYQNCSVPTLTKIFKVLNIEVSGFFSNTDQAI